MLFVYQEADQIVAWPFLLRPLRAVAGLAHVGGGLWDATSVYGYPGPISSPGAQVDPAFLDRFGAALQAAAKDLHLVTAFSRLNPLLENRRLVPSLGVLDALGETVSIDLSLGTHTQWRNYRKSHRYEVNRARKEGMVAFHDENWRCFDEFVRLYTQTMDRVGAAERYFYDKLYFHQLREALGGRLKLFVAEHGGTVCSGALFVHTGKIVQYHLSGSAPDSGRLAPSKLVLDEARQWANSANAQLLHLGGGVGSQEDSLFRFKAGFSPTRHRFFVWKWIVLPEVCGELVRVTRDRSADCTDTTVDFFPAYRIR